MRFGEEVVLEPHIIEEHIKVTDEDLKSRLINGTYRDMRYVRFSQNIASKFFDERVPRKRLKILSRLMRTL